MSEDALWDNARGKMAPFGRLRRIENRCDLGTPDVFHTLRNPADPHSVSKWTELKHRPAWPDGISTPLVLPKLTLEQVLWAEEEHMAGGKVGMLVQVGSDYIYADVFLTRAIYDRAVTETQLRKHYPYHLHDRVLDRKWLLHWMTL